MKAATGTVAQTNAIKRHAINVFKVNTKKLAKLIIIIE